MLINYILFVPCPCISCRAHRYTYIYIQTLINFYHWVQPEYHPFEAEQRLLASVKKIALVQIMACPLFSAKPLPNPKMACCYLATCEKNQWEWKWNTPIFMQELNCNMSSQWFARFMWKYSHLFCTFPHMWIYAFRHNAFVQESLLHKSPNFKLPYRRGYFVDRFRRLIPSS